MGWLFKSGCSRQALIAERTEDWRRTAEDGLVVKSTCLAHCYRGGAFSGVLWTVWGRSFTRDGAEIQPAERWIGCAFLRTWIARLGQTSDRHTVSSKRYSLGSFLEIGSSYLLNLRVRVAPHSISLQLDASILPLVRNQFNQGRVVFVE
jgi:hypothetical protein